MGGADQRGAVRPPASGVVTASLSGSRAARLRACASGCGGRSCTARRRAALSRCARTRCSARGRRAACASRALPAVDLDAVGDEQPAAQVDRDPPTAVGALAVAAPERFFPSDGEPRPAFWGRAGRGGRGTFRVAVEAGVSRRADVSRVRGSRAMLASALVSALSVVGFGEPVCMASGACLHGLTHAAMLHRLTHAAMSHGLPWAACRRRTAAGSGQGGRGRCRAGIRSGPPWPARRVP